MSTRLLTSEEVEGLIGPADLFTVLEEVHRGIAVGRVLQPVPDALAAEDGDPHTQPAAIPMLAGDLGSGDVVGKGLADAPGNRSRGLPAQRSSIQLIDFATGECRGVVDGRALTRLRTAATTAVATRALARCDSRTLALLGAGALAVEHARALCALREYGGPDFEQLVMWSRTRERAQRAALELRDLGVPVQVVGTAEDAVERADVVCTLTPAVEPFVRAEWLRPGTLLAAVGSPPRPFFSEVLPEVFARADTIVVDRRELALRESGNVRGAVAAGALEPARLTELGEVLAGPVEISDSALRVFNSVGIAAQDLAAARLVLGLAGERGIGRTVSLRQ